jgi:ABC-2 type transport system permease protein
MKPAATAAEAANAAAKASNPVARILSLIMAGQMIFWAFYTGAYSMMSILREDEQGTLARLFTTPTNRTLILGGKFVSVILMVSVQAAVMLAFGQLVFKVNWGQPLSMLMMVFGQVVAATGLGVLLISLVRNSRQGGTVIGGSLSALGMLGGLFTIAAPMPPAFDRLALITPHGWVMQGWKLVLAGSPPGDILVTTLVLVLMGTGLFAGGAAIFRRRFA